MLDKHVPICRAHTAHQPPLADVQSLNPPCTTKMKNGGRDVKMKDKGRDVGGIDSHIQK
jgi:hypothetical protein